MSIIFSNEVTPIQTGFETSRRFALCHSPAPGNGEEKRLPDTPLYDMSAVADHEVGCKRPCDERVYCLR
jgi:hypothetical protein